jgi:hypothetical protein
MIRFLSYIIKLTKWNRYYYFKNNNFEDITLIILFLNLLCINDKIKKYIFSNNIYIVNDNKIYKMGDNKTNMVKTKIIKSLIYKDRYYKIDLSKVKNKIYIIKDSTSIDFILKYFYNINRNNESIILINYFRNNSKILKLNFSTCIRELY